LPACRQLLPPHGFQEIVCLATACIQNATQKNYLPYCFRSLLRLKKGALILNTGDTIYLLRFLLNLNAEKNETNFSKWKL
jgi:hypothetical protein